jgi:hypothetical protein
MVAERLMYMPSMGFAIIIAFAATTPVRARSWLALALRVVRWCVCAAVLASYIMPTLERNEVCVW